MSRRPGEFRKILTKSETLNDTTCSPTYWRAPSHTSQTLFFHRRPTYFRRSFSTSLALVPLPPCPLFPFIYQLSTVVLTSSRCIQCSCANTAVTHLNLSVAVLKTDQKGRFKNLCECRKQTLCGLRKTIIS